MENKRPPAQVIHRKPLPQLPADQGAATSQPNASSALTQKLEDLQLQEHGHGQTVGAPPLRHGTASTFPTLSSPSTWASTSSSSKTADTAATTPTSTTSLKPPALPPRRPSGDGRPGVAATTIVGQFRSATAPATSSSDKKEPSVWKTALDETRFFAAGLVHKPYESTKHYTILRHSSGLVMYRGPSTNVAVTVFSTPDHPIPADRTLWMQRRGYSGDTGLKLKTLVGASGSWLDVTPGRQIHSASDLPSADERGYQRDIGKIMKKVRSNSEKALARRQPRETFVVRIPAAAADGYFRLVLCTGGAADSRTGVVTKRKTLCGSPVFRVASTSTDSSIFRGASLRTLPAEAGVKIVSMLGTNYVSAAVEPVVGAVQSQVENYQPGTVQTLAAQTAYDTTGVQDKLDAAGASYEERRQAAYDALYQGPTEEDEAPPESIGPDSGPEQPFPMPFQGRVVRGTGRSTAELGVPTANLADVPDDVRLRLRGLYFGWATVVSKGGKKMGAAADDAVPATVDNWIEAVIAIGPSPWGPSGKAATSVVVRNEVAVHLLYEFGPDALLDAKLKVLLMGFLRPLPPPSSTTTTAAAAAAAAAVSGASNNDARVVVTSLSRPHWGPQTTLERIASEKSARSFSDKYVESRTKLQKQVDKIPLHWAGVRTEGSELRDRLYGNGGYWIAR